MPSKLTKQDIDYPRDVFDEIIAGDSPYAFYLFQWVPYQTDARRWRLKMQHDVKTFDGQIAEGIWPNADHLRVSFDLIESARAVQQEETK